MTFAFNVTFTRADEQHATTHVIGYNRDGGRRHEAEQRLRADLRHLTILDVVLVAVRDDDGVIIEEPAFRTPALRSDDEQAAYEYEADHAGQQDELEPEPFDVQAAIAADEQRTADEAAFDLAKADAFFAEPAAADVVLVTPSTAGLLRWLREVYRTEPAQAVHILLAGWPELTDADATAILTAQDGGR